ncbi:hypothetical protein SCHPADRAFT_285852 [Schizopora paradoxa]|uniref:Uncharacterized protein n=1 Tax=Schizopora paradoxa TaxID=27342 RepID=A0A0H2RTC3_9AGAM|nr:hypothetical protein SCHPADRAFT_285852 [Schizopora paradoxa]
MTPTELFEKECARVWESSRILEKHLNSREEMLEYTQWYYNALVELGYPNDCDSSLEEIEGTALPNDIRQQLLAVLQWPFDIYEVLAERLKMSGMSLIVGTTDFSDLCKAGICSVLAPAIVAILQEVTSLAVWLEKEWIDKNDPTKQDPDEGVAAKDHFGLLKTYTFVQIQELFVTNLFDTVSTAWNRRKKGKDVLDELLKDFKDDDFEVARKNVKMALMQGTEIVFQFLREYVRVHNQEVMAARQARQAPQPPKTWWW